MDDLCFDIQSMQCCLSNDGHIVNEPFQLPCSGRFCRQCVELVTTDMFRCYLCGCEHSRDILDCAVEDETAELQVIGNIEDLNENLKKEMNKTVQEYEDSNPNELLNNAISFIEADIDLQLESFKNQLDQTYNEYKNNLKHIKTHYEQEIKHIEEKFKDLRSSDFDKSLKSFHSKQEALNYTKKAIFKFKSSVKQIRLYPPFKNIVTSNFGILTKGPLEQVASSNTIPLDGVKLKSVAYLKDSPRLIFIQKDSLSLLVYHLHSQYLEEFSHKRIVKPFASCSGKNSELFISDHEDYAKVLMFDANLIFIQEIRLARSIAKTDIFYLTADAYHSSNLIYVSIPEKNQVLTFDTVDGDNFEAINVDNPRVIAVSDEHIYVISKKVLSSSKDCILVFDKSSYKNIDKIEINSCSDLIALSLDDSMNIVVTGVNSNSKSSDEYYCFIIDKNKVILKKIQLDKTAHLSNDIIFFENKIVQCFDSCFKLTELK